MDKRLSINRALSGSPAVDQPLDELGVSDVEYGPATEQPWVPSSIRASQEEASKMVVFELQRL